MNYLRNLVICTFRALHPDVPTVTDGELQAFDQTLFDTYDAEVRNQAGGIAMTQFNRSMLVFASATDQGSTVASQVGAGRAFFLSANPVP